MVTNGTELRGYATLFTLLLQIVLPSSAVKLDVDKMQVGALVYYFCPNNEVVSRKLVKTLVIKTNKYPSIVYVIDIYVRMQGFDITYHK